jgi:hypothetical protein
MKTLTRMGRVNTRARAPQRQSTIVRSVARKAASIGIAIVMGNSLALAAEPGSEEPAHVQWRETMVHMETPRQGCFRAAFPSTLWEEVSCRTADIHAHSVPRPPQSGLSQTTGNGADYVLAASGLISQTVGSFPSVSAVTFESNVGVPAFGDLGILGSNEYSLQINTNANLTTSACAGATGSCTVWQQFLYATDYLGAGTAAVYMEYWLLDWGPDCPSGWATQGNDCWKNSAYTDAPDVPIQSLENLRMTGTVVPGGNDTVAFANGTVAYSLSAPDSVVQIGTVWNQSEFNVVGDTDGSEAVFDGGASITVNVAAQFGSTAAPVCLSGDGSTGETNNLNLGSCVTAGGSTPSIQFTESIPAAPAPDGTGYYLAGCGVMEGGGFVGTTFAQAATKLQSDGLTTSPPAGKPTSCGGSLNYYSSTEWIAYEEVWFNK